MTFNDDSLIAVVGGSIAAVTAADALRLEGFDGRIQVISDEDVAPYTRIPLSKGLLAGTETVASTELAPLGDDVEMRLGVRATGLHLEKRVLETTDGPIEFDGLVLASGARARRLTTVGDREYVIRNRDDALRLRVALTTAETVVVVGGGFLGMEVAATARSLGRCVTVVDREPALQRLLGVELSEFVRRRAAAEGVQVAVEPGGVRLDSNLSSTALVLQDGRRLVADVVVTAVGDIANVEWLAGSGLAIGDGVLVDERCFAAPGIVAAGDVAAFPRSGGPHRRLPNWTNAIEQARAASRALLLGDKAPPYAPTPYTFTDQFGLDVKLVGPPPPMGEAAVVEGDLESGSALLRWCGEASDESVSTHVAAVNHPMAPARLKRLLRTA